MRGLALLVLGCALSVPTASLAADALTRLREEPLLPATRDALVQELCDAPLTPEQLRGLFHSAVRTGALDAARIAACRRDEAMIPLMVSEFTGSQIGAWGASDPDIFERLLRGLQGFPPDRIRAALAGVSHADLVEAIRDRFVSNSVANLAEDPEHPPLAHLTPAQAERAEATVSAWFDELLDHGERGLQWLQTDSGGALWMLQSALQFQFVGELIEHGTAAEARIGVELLNQLPGESSPTLPTAIRVYPVEPFEVQVPPGTWLQPPGRRPLPPVVPVALLALLGLGLWALALRRWPRSRVVLFPVGAVLLVAVGLLAVEALLAAVGVKPLAAVRPTFDPNQVSRGLYEPVDLEGQPHLVSTQGGHRYHAMATPRPAGLRRVVVLGESSVHGTHYLAEEAFPAVLEAGLDDVEVINAGLGGAVSDEILHAGIEALSWDPDLLILYLGFNDLTHLPYMGRFRGYDAQFMKRRALLGQWRLVTALRGVLPQGLLEAAPTDAQPSYLDPQEQTPEELLALTDLARHNAVTNTVHLVLAARDRGVQVLLVAQLSNEGACPEVSVGRAEMVSRSCYREELAAISREAARRTGAPLFEADRMIRSVVQAEPQAGVAYPWPDYFWDGVHPTRLGHAMLGQALRPVVAGILNERAGESP